MRPLDDVTVVDSTQALVGPLTTQVLGDLGAEIIKIERPEHGDLTRHFAPDYGEQSAYFTSLNRNKRSITLDLTTNEGTEILYKMVEKADIFVQNFSPGLDSKFGVTYDDLKNINGSIIYCDISGYGSDGPKSDEKLFDIIAQAESGLMSVTGFEDSPPVRIGISISDISAAMTSIYGILAALYSRTKTGEGQYIDIALLDSSFQFLFYHITNYFATGESPTRMGSRHPNLSPYQAFEAKDAYFVVGVVSEDLWPKFCNAIDMGWMIDDEKFETFEDRIENRNQLDDILSRKFSNRPVEYWLEKLDQNGVPSSKVNSIEDIVSSPHIDERDMVVDFESNDGVTIKLPGTPVMFDELELQMKRPPPTLGQHTDEILQEYGYSESEIKKFESDGIT